MSSKLVLSEGWLFWGEGITGIKDIVAQELKHAAMNLIGSRPGRHIDIGAGSLTEFSRSDVGLDLKLLNGVNRWLNGKRLEEGLVIVDSVKGVIVVFGTGTADCHAAATGLENGAGLTNGTGNEIGQLGETSAVEGQFHYLLVFNDRTNC